MFGMNNEKNKSSVILNPERSEWVSRSHVTGVEPVINAGVKTKRYSAKRDLYGDFAYAQPLKMTEKVLSFLRLRGASGVQGISAPASCRKAHKRRFILNQWLLHFANASLRMTIPALAFLLSLNLSTAFAYCDCDSDGNTLTISNCSGGYLADSSCADQKTANNIIIGTGVTSIGTNAFYGASSLTSITIPEGVTSIGVQAFLGASSLKSITIPEGVTSIGYNAFLGASSLESITIPKGVTSIGGGAFYNASSLTSITIPKGVTSIGESAFEFATGLTSITIPDSVTSIGRYVFWAASSLTSITIPDSVTSIGGSAFNGGCSLESITVPDSVTYVGGDAFLSVKEIIISDKLDMSGWNNDALKDDGDGTVTFKCKGNQEICRAKIAEFASRATYISGNNIIFDAGDHRECFRTSEDDENVSYYHTGTECAELPESGNITCASGYADYNGNCYAQLPFSKKRWTPAEANQWLHDGNDNFVVITFKK